MNAKTAVAWVEAAQWLSRHPDAPRILAQEAAKRSRVALRRTRPAKPALRLPGRKKAVTIPKLKKDLDRVFSLFIRQRDSHGSGRCRTCGYIAPWQEMDCGHYQPRQDLATRWDEKNCHIQCKSCNGFRGGEPEKMAAYIDHKYGPGTAAELRELGKRPFRLNRQWLEAKIRHYKTQIGESASPPKAEP